MPWTWRWKRRHNPSVTRKTVNHSADNGLKPLYSGPDPQLDIVAVHGLNGHRMNSWTAPNGVNWLQDLLPADLPHTRIYTWGYHAPTGTTESGMPSLQKVSENLVSDLLAIRESTRTNDRPIIFIAHSVGGTIVKSALLYSMQHGASPSIRNISLSTYGVVYVGTPELDQRLAGLQSYLASNQVSDEDLSDSFKEARWLLGLLQRYSSVSDKFRTIVVRESLDASAIGGQSTQAVSSSTHAVSISINADHDSMNKFESLSNPGYIKVKWHLCIMANDILERTNPGLRS